MFRLAHGLRDQNLSVEYSLGDDKVGKQLKLADARGAQLAVVLGPEERARGTVVVKRLADGSQREVAENDLANELHKELHG